MISPEIKKIVKKWERLVSNRRFRTQTQMEKSRAYLFRTQKKDYFKWLDRLFIRKRNFNFYTVFSFSRIAKYKKYSVSFFIIGVFLVAASVYIIGFSPYFQIAPSKVIIARTDTLSDINIAYKSIENVYGQSIFLFSTDEVIKNLTDLQKNITNVKVSRLLPNGLKIVVSSSPSVFSTTLP